MINITFPDGNVKQYPAGVTGSDIAKSISNSLEKKVLAAKVNNEVWETTRPIDTDANIVFLTWDDKDGKSTFWHSSAHLMAEAIQTIFPQVKFTIGPPIDNGFYYDIDFGGHVPKAEDLEQIEKLMLKLAAQNNAFKRRNVTKEEALDFYQTNEYKTELIKDLVDGEITFYQQGNFVDLCRGPHIPHTGYVKAVKLLNIAGAYWRGDENRPQLTRIYGITFPKQQELDDYLTLLEEAKNRDHRKLGTQLGLFAFSDRVGQGLPLWLPKGAKLRELLQDFLRLILFFLSCC